MSTADDALTDALGFIARSREDIERGHISSALLQLCAAERFYGLAMGAAAGFRVLGVAQPANADAIERAIVALRTALTTAITPAPAATIRDVLVTVNEGLAPLLRELATPHAEPGLVVRARAANVAAILIGEYDVRARR